jgi:hypothetical protein
MAPRHAIDVKGDKTVLTKSSLSSAQKRLIEILQKLNYGKIERLAVRDGAPAFDPPPRIIRDVKLGAGDNGARSELDSPDFALKREHIELFENLKRLGHGVVECIEVKAGLPFRVQTIEERM